jgi:hypothetical protein
VLVVGIVVVGHAGNDKKTDLVVRADVHGLKTY